jgi:hypothetical protein
MSTPTVTTTVPDVTELFQRSQDTVRAIGEAYTSAVKDAFAALPSFPSVASLPTTAPTAGDAAAAVDGIYDYAHKAISIQQAFVKRVATAATV